MPIATGFLSPEEFAHEYFFDLRVSFCPQCRMVSSPNSRSDADVPRALRVLFIDIGAQAQHVEAFATRCAAAT